MQQCYEFIAALVEDYEVTVAPVSSKATPADGHKTETRKEQRWSVLMLFSAQARAGSIHLKAVLKEDVFILSCARRPAWLWLAGRKRSRRKRHYSKKVGYFFTKWEI